MYLIYNPLNKNTQIKPTSATLSVLSVCVILMHVILLCLYFFCKRAVYNIQCCDKEFPLWGQ